MGVDLPSPEEEKSHHVFTGGFFEEKKFRILF
jgi:hypothetical protein